MAVNGVHFGSSTRAGHGPIRVEPCSPLPCTMRERSLGFASTSGSRSPAIRAVGVAVLLGNVHVAAASGRGGKVDHR